MGEQDIILKLNDYGHEIAMLKDRMENCERTQESIHSLTLSVHELALNIEHIAKTQDIHGNRLTALEKEPAETWKEYKKVVISCITTGVIGIILGALFALILK